MNNVVIRDITENDVPTLKAFMVAAWGDGWNLKRFDQNPGLFQALLDTYLSIFLESSTFGKVATLNGEVVGAILGSADGEKPIFRQFQKNIAPNVLALLGATPAERADIMEHLSVSFQSIGALLESRRGAYGGSLEYLVVSEKARGLKIGKRLWDEVSAYFCSQKTEAIYLITDSQCNVGFYDHNGFSRVATVPAVYHFAAGQKTFDIHLYAFQFNARKDTRP